MFAFFIIIYLRLKVYVSTLIISTWKVKSFILTLITQIFTLFFPISVDVKLCQKITIYCKHICNQGYTFLKIKFVKSFIGNFYFSKDLIIVVIEIYTNKY